METKKCTTVISDNELGDLLRTALTELYGVKVWWNADENGSYHISAYGKIAVVTRDEVLGQQTSAKGLVEMLKEKLDL